MADPKAADLGLRLLLHCRNALYEEFPFLDGAFASLPGQMGETLETMGTDGVRLYAAPMFLVRQFERQPAALRRGYLHLLLHCLYLHLFERERDERRWNLASDMAVEQVLETVESLKAPGSPVKADCLRLLGEGTRSAEQIYAMLEDGAFPYPIEALEDVFRFDDHRLWRRKEASCDGVREKWEKLLTYASKNRQGSQRRGTKAGTGSELLRPRENGVRDYHRFLRRFMIPREELELDTESFDYIYYNYGMERYGNLPLIEPLEYKEVNRLEELVIAIDTSGSCSAETVSRFLTETFGIFREKENFFRKMKVYLIQCDCMVQTVEVIRSEEAWKRCSEQIVIQGRGGTDFTPVFRYVEKLREEKELKNLKALIYFTDGDGFYPREAPDYETAFVFVEQTAGMAMVPQWAHRLLAKGGTA